MKHALRITAILIMVVLFLAGCQKETNDLTVEPQPGDNSSTEGSLIIGDRTFEGLNGLMDDYFTASGLKSTSVTCPSITATLNTAFPLTISIDWGTGCTSTGDGVTRKGKISVSLTGMMNVINSRATFSFNEFVSEGFKITGVHKITYLGLNPNNNWPKYSVFTEAKIVFPDEKFIIYRAEYIRLKSEGASTLTLQDDVWRIEGSSSGVTKQGIAWTASYPSAVVKKNSCKWFSSGSVLITPAGMLPRTIDFGDGTCDNKATLTIGDRTVNIEL